MGLYRNLAGSLRLRLTSADTAGFLLDAADAGIEIVDIDVEDELTAVFTVSRRDYKKLLRIAARREDNLALCRRRGIYWDLRNLMNRPVLVTGLAILLFLALFLPSRVLIIQVEGNSSIPANRILETAEQCGIRFWASRRAVRSEQVKNALLEAMPELSWAGVNTYGSRAVISVRQREEEPEERETPAVSSIVAARDGVILSCDVLSGNGLCAPGQAVQAGEVLISGYTDCGLCVTATRAAGEVTAATSRSLTAVTQAKKLQKGTSLEETVQFSLIVGKNRINFRKNSGISGSSCGRMVTNYHLTLPGGHRLPVTLVKETVTDAGLSVTNADGEALLKEFAVRYLGTQMIAGTVTEAVETVTEEDGVWVLTGDYACTEMIGRERAEQNGELHETS